MIDTRKKQFWFVVFHACAFYCIYAAATIMNIPLRYILKAVDTNDLYMLAAGVIITLEYFVIIWFLIFVIGMAWYNVYKKYQEESEDEQEDIQEEK